MLLVAFALFYTSLAGMSGGGLVVPVCIGFMRFDARNAIALSNFSIFVGSAIRFLTFSGEAHPKKNGKGLLVDHNLAILTLPLIIMRVSVGILANITVPAVIILGFFVFGCVLLSVSIVKKANRIYAAENEATIQKEVELAQTAKPEAANVPVPSTLINHTQMPAAQIEESNRP